MSDIDDLLKDAEEVVVTEDGEIVPLIPKPRRSVRLLPHTWTVE